MYQNGPGLVTRQAEPVSRDDRNRNLMAKKTIHTLNARDHIVLEGIRDRFQMGPAPMRYAIDGMLAQTEEILASKGIKYGNLKSALVPNPKRHEIALVFDTQNTRESRYSIPIYSALIPLLSKRSNHSILAGDYVGNNDQQDLLRKSFFESVQLIKKVEWRCSDQFFIVYVNNLTNNRINILRNGLAAFEPFVGLGDTTFASNFKWCLSTMLVNECLKHKNIILMPHEGDRDNSEDVNLRKYPWEDFGYLFRSLQDIYFGVFLSYKIERPVVQGFESDTVLSINAVSSDPLPIADFNILVDQNRFRYLSEQKTAILKRIGLLDGDFSQLQDMISERISSNYIYNMEHDDQYNVTKFNMILEIHPTDNAPPQRVLAALEYKPADRCLRLITLY